MNNNLISEIIQREKNEATFLFLIRGEALKLCDEGFRQSVGPLQPEGGRDQ